MSIVSSRVMGTPFFHELKKNASFFFREKIKTARLALTDVTPAQLLTEEATNGNPWAPDARTMSFILQAAFEIDDYLRIVDILHKRLSRFDRKIWREPYQALLVLEHLLTHGPESTAEEFQSDREVIENMGTFQCIDERGFNWGLTVQKKSERILKLLEKGPLLKEERNQARKISRGIQGFGSVNYRCSSDHDTSSIDRGSDYFRKCNSHYEHYDEQDEGGVLEDSSMGETNIVRAIVPPTKSLPEEESKPLLVCDEERPKFEFHKEEHHPFNNIGNQSIESTLLSSQS